MVSDYMLTTRIGIHTAGVHRVKTEYGLELFGSGVNVAARIESMARADEILVSQTTYKLLDKETSGIFHSSREVELKHGSPFEVWSSSLPEIDDVTRLLREWSNGNQTALEKLLPLVERELHRLAHIYMRREDPHHTLQTTALINETYLRLIDRRDVQWQNRAHFFGVAAQIMRRILLNYARDRSRAKRGGRVMNVELSEAEIMPAEKDAELIALNEALQRLEAVDPRKSKVVELRFFGGLTVEEVAEVLRVSPIVVMRDWAFAKAWLAREM
jgi:RNA polymerase sigma factor (TIGR02999 family)